eukprot:COSAG04_NODE_3701_length_2595_cov_639.635016_2_plen_213_part_00
MWGQHGWGGVGLLLLRWWTLVVPRGTRRPLAGVCWSGPTPGSIRSSPAPPAGACGLRQPSPRRAAVPGAAAATASWCGDHCCCRYGPLWQLCGRDLRALAAPARCPEAAPPARHSRQLRRHRRLIAPRRAGRPAAREGSSNRGRVQGRRELCISPISFCTQAHPSFCMHTGPPTVARARPLPRRWAPAPALAPARRAYQARPPRPLAWACAA